MLSFDHVGPGDGTLVIRFVGECLCSLRSSLWSQLVSFFCSMNSCCKGDVKQKTNSKALDVVLGKALVH